MSLKDMVVLPTDQDATTFVTRTPELLLGVAKWAFRTDDNNWDGFHSDFDQSQVFEKLAPEDIDKHRPAIEADLARLLSAERPLRDEDLAVLVARLDGGTRSRADTGLDRELWVDGMIEGLSQWPADVAVEAVTRYLRGSIPFRPVMADLLWELRRLAAPRRAVIAALRRLLEPQPPRLTKQAHTPPDAAKRAKAQGYLDQIQRNLAGMMPDKRKPPRPDWLDEPKS